MNASFHPNRPLPGRTLAIRRCLAAVALFAVLGMSFPVPALGATTTLALSPSSGTSTKGSTFSVTVVVNAGQAINAAEATVNFPKDKLEAKSVSKSGSKFSLWAVEPKISNANGTVTFSGGLPTPGFTGQGGKILSITFLATATGSARLTLSGAQVLANDGEGTNVLSSTGSGNYTINAPAPEPEPGPAPEPAPAEPSRPAPTISSASHPDQNAWYSSRTIQASWSAGAGVTGYNALFDQQEGTVPTEVSGGLGATLNRAVDADGVWYLHIRARYGTGWSATTHYTFRIDTTAPETFTPTIEREDESSRTATVLFATSDTPSGIARYEMGLDGANPTTAMSPLTLGDLSAGDHTVLVRAIDFAGNVTEATQTFSVTAIEPPTVALETDDVRLPFGGDGLPIVVNGKPFRLHGFAFAGDTIRIVVRSQESVFTFPVAEIVDPDPIEPAPPGMTAWKVELDPALAPGEHTIHVTRTNAQGQESPEAPVIRFRVVSNVVQVGGILIPFSLIIQVQWVIIVLLLGIILLLLIRRRHRNRRIDMTLPPGTRSPQTPRPSDAADRKEKEHPPDWMIPRA
ncbi:MAG: hypothetical protein HY340_01295 [Candidatus Kerfeldbacteria bacterium]|nr:hypothetical protein [Candidatus Kerfeldbacteria bacterium]